MNEIQSCLFKWQPEKSVENFLSLKTHNMPRSKLNLYATSVKEVIRRNSECE